MPSYHSTRDTKETLVSVKFVGDEGVGKTALMYQIADGAFVDPATVGYRTDFKTRTYPDTVNGKPLKLKLILPSKQNDRLQATKKSSSHLILLCFDLTNVRSLDNLKTWISEETHSAKKYMLVGTKSDSDRRTVGDSAIESARLQLSKLLKAKETIPYYKTSAMKGQGTDELFEAAAKLIGSTLPKTDSAGAKSPSSPSETIETFSLVPEKWSAPSFLSFFGSKSLTQSAVITGSARLTDWFFTKLQQIAESDLSKVLREKLTTRRHDKTAFKLNYSRLNQDNFTARVIVLIDGKESLSDSLKQLRKSLTALKSITAQVLFLVGGAQPDLEGCLTRLINAQLQNLNSHGTPLPIARQVREIDNVGNGLMDLRDSFATRIACGKEGDYKFKPAQPLNIQALLRHLPATETQLKEANHTQNALKAQHSDGSSQPAGAANFFKERAASAASAAAASPPSYSEAMGTGSKP